MSSLLIVLLVVLVVALAVVVVLLLVRRTSGGGSTVPAPTPGAPQDPFASVGETAGDPRSIKAGDMVEYLGRQYFVRGSLRLREGGYAWSEHILDADTDGQKIWISVEEDPDLEVVWWTEQDAEELLPDRKNLTYEGVEYQRVEHGTADYSSEGTTGVGASGRVEYVDYEAKGNRYLAFERFLGAPSSSGASGGSWEASTGERVPNGALTIYPGS
jgi:hypothetical protein